MGAPPNPLDVTPRSRLYFQNWYFYWHLVCFELIYQVPVFYPQGYPCPENDQIDIILRHLYRDLTTKSQSHKAEFSKGKKS